MADGEGPGQAVAAIDGRVRRGRSRGDWYRTDLSLIGRQVWERRFAGQADCGEVQVTVHFDPHKDVVQTLYAARMEDTDSAPQIPGRIRQQVQAFAQDLRSR